jgi:hypothetical protein
MGTGLYTAHESRPKKDGVEPTITALEVLGDPYPR